MRDNNLFAFTQTTLPLTTLCPAVRVSAIVTPSPSGWTVLIGHVMTLPERPAGERNLFRQFGGLAGITAIVDRKDLGNFVEALHRGELLFPDGPEIHSARLDLGRPVPEGDGTPCPDWRSRTYESRLWAETKFGLDWPLYYTATSGRSVSDMLPHERIEESVAELPVGSPPFAGINHLLGRLEIHEDGTDLSRMSSYIHFLVPVWVRLRPALHSAKDNRLRVTVEAKGQFVQSARVSVMPGGKVEGTVVPLGEFSASAEGGDLWTKEFDFPVGKEPVRIALSVDGKGVDNAVIASPDERLALHLLYDPELEKIGMLLGVEKPQRDAAQFEEGVTNFIHLLGFSSARYGHKLFGESPDALALNDGRPFLLVVECTTGAPTVEKWSTLRHRANEVIRAMKTRGLPCFVAPILFTQTDDSVLNKALVKDARAEGVAVLSRDDLAGLLESRRQGADLASFRSYFQSAAHPDDFRSTINLA